MALPNMAMIPSGYKPTKLYSVLPTESLGSEEVLNGDFATDSDWSKQTGWTISGGKAVATSCPSGNTIGQGSLAPVIGKTYKITFKVSEYTVGGVTTKIGGVQSSSKTSNGNYTVFLTAISTATFSFQVNNISTLKIDNVSVKEVLVGNADFDVTRATPATRVNQQGLIETPEFIESGDLVTNGDFSDGSNGWVIENAWTISNGVANGNGANGASDELKTSLGVTIPNKEYKYSFEIKNYVSGNVKLMVFNQPHSGNGVFEGYYKATSETKLRFYPSNFIGSITNISIIEVERNNIPRLDYTDGTCPVLLTEPQRTNNLLYSQELDNAWWLKSNVTITPNTSTSPDGALNAQTLTSIAINSVVYRTGIACGSLSFFAKDIDLSIGKFRISVDNVGVCLWNKDGTLYSVNGGTATNGVDYGNGWFRFAFNVTSGSVVNYGIGNGSGSESILVFGLQNEPSATYPTSYIPTNGSTVTRNQDIVNNAGTSATYNSTEGVLYLEFKQTDLTTTKYLSLNSGSGVNEIRIRPVSSGYRVDMIVNSVNVYDSGVITADQSIYSKIAFSWKLNEFKLYINGVNEDEQLSGIVFPSNTLNNLDLTRGSGTFPLLGKTSQVQVFNTALSDFDLRNLTSNATAYATYETMRTSLNFNIQ